MWKNNLLKIVLLPSLLSGLFSGCATRPLDLEKIETMPFIPFSGSASVEKGQQLFENKQLGTSKNKKSCHSCHKRGKGLEKATSKSYDTLFGFVTRDLEDVINLCVALPIKGKPFLKESQEMADIKAYIATFEKKNLR